MNEEQHGRGIFTSKVIYVCVCVSMFNIDVVLVNMNGHKCIDDDVHQELVSIRRYMIF